MSDPNDAATLPVDAVQNAPPATTRWQKSPVIAIHSSWLRRNYKITASQLESAYLDTASFLTTIARRGTCINKSNKSKTTKCTCLNELCNDNNSDEAIQATSRYLVDHFALTKKTEQQQLLIEWMKYAAIIGKMETRQKKSMRCYVMPGHPTSLTICSNTLSEMLGFGADKWKTAKGFFSSTDSCSLQ